MRPFPGVLAFMSRSLAVAATLGILARHASAQQGPRLTIEPRGAEGGSLVRLTIDHLSRYGAGDSVRSVTGTMAGEPLHFRPASSPPGQQGDQLERFEALGGVPIAVSDSLVAFAEVMHESGAVDTVQLWLKYPHQVPSEMTPTRARGRIVWRRGRRLRVDRQFTQRLDSATEARIEHENEMARDVGRRAQETPPLWTLDFLRPRAARVTSRFGSGRVFNGRVASSHLGIDYRGALGDPIYAANRGVVALVANFFLAGNVVYIDHGDGIVTGYFHMSEPEVAVGDTVERGQEIGRVGATGRVTGPHLHWAARFGALTIDPGDLLRLRPPFVVATARVSKASRMHRGP